MRTKLNNEWPRAQDAVAAAAAKILPDTTLLGVTGTMPQGVILLRLAGTPGFQFSTMTNLYGSLAGFFPLYGGGLQIGAIGDATKDCRLSSLQCSMMVSTAAQSVIVYGNATPWTLDVANIALGGQQFTLTAPDANLTAVSVAVASGITAIRGAFDLSGNDITNIDSLLTFAMGLTVTTAASMNLTGGTTVGPSDKIAWVKMMTAIYATWTITVNTNHTVVVSGLDPDPSSVNGTYVWDNGEQAFVKGLNTITVGPWAAYGNYPVISIDGTPSYHGNTLEESTWYDSVDAPVSMTTALAGAWP